MFKHYLSTALRHFGRNRATSLISVLCLSLGIACFVAAYAVVRYLQSGETAFPDTDRTYYIAQTSNGVPLTTPTVLAKNLRADFPELIVARATGGLFSLGDSYVKVGERTVGATPVFVDADFLKIFPLRMIAGNPATALTQPRSAILTEDAARRYFDTIDVVGKNIELNRELLTIAGVVTPPPQPSHLSASPLAVMRFDVLASMDVYDRLAETQTGQRIDDNRWNSGVYVTYAQFPRDRSLTVEQFNARMESFAERRIPKGDIRRAFAARHITTLTSSLGDVFTGSVATLLMSLGGIVLLVACLNYANLATAQAAERAKEVGMRKVLGATRAQLIAQYLFETGLLTAASSAIALATITVIIVLLNASTGIDVSIVLMSSAGFWLFLAGLLASVSIAAGAYPAFVLARSIPVLTLRAGRSRLGNRKLAAILVGVQFMVASLMVIAVFSIYRQNNAMHASFNTPTDQAVLIDTNLRSVGVQLESLRTELLRSPAIEAVSASRVPPWSPAMSTLRMARSAEGVQNGTHTRLSTVANDYFAVFDLPIVAGRAFDARLDSDEQPNERLSANVIVDREFVRQLGFSTPADALNAIVYYPSGNSSPPTPVRIIGVVETRQMSLIGMGVSANIYSFGISKSNFAVIRLARSSIPEGLAAIDASWRRLSPDTPLKRSFVDELFERSYRYFEGTRRILTAIAIFAFAIAAMGLVGMAVHIVGKRRHEIGVRKTLGATQRRVMWMLMWDFSKPVLIANLIAWPLAFGVEQGYARVIVDRAPLSIGPYLLGMVVTLLIAWSATGLQAQRAARLHPATVLRHE